MKMIRKGEYDLVNISLLGFDPCTGRPFAECISEWREYLAETVQMAETTPWWNIVRQIKIRWRIMKLYAKQGM